MYKIGDKVKVIGVKSACARRHQGKIFTVTKTTDQFYVLLDCGCSSGIWNDDVRLYKVEPKNDIEWLDRIQENFKDG